MKISQQQYEEFVKYFTWEYMQNPYYRVGQAFINYFPTFYRNMLDDGDHGQMEATKLWNNADPSWCWNYIRRFVQE